MHDMLCTVYDVLSPFVPLHEWTNQIIEAEQVM
jgi:hypothetical protein